MQYTEIRLETSKEQSDRLIAILTALDLGGLYIEDYSDLLETGDVLRMDAIDEALLAKDKSRVAVCLYAPDPERLAGALAFIAEYADGIDYSLTTRAVDEEDFANAWKQYYTIQKPADRLVIVPKWLTYDPAPGEIPLYMDPGMAFGTGSHETTRLCIALLEQALREGDSLLDVGTGSGILAIGGKLLRAGRVVGCDIEPVAVRVAKENAENNGVLQQISFVQSDLTAGVTGQFAVITVNIIADVILRLLPMVGQFLAPGGRLILSGIIDLREDDVLAALPRHGLRAADRKEEKGWIALLCERT